MLIEHLLYIRHCSKCFASDLFNNSECIYPGHLLCPCKHRNGQDQIIKIVYDTIIFSLNSIHSKHCLMVLSTYIHYEFQHPQNVSFIGNEPIGASLCAPLRESLPFKMLIIDFVFPANSVINKKVNKVSSIIHSYEQRFRQHFGMSDNFTLFCIPALQNI